MRARWLGWAGVEIEVDDETVVVDTLTDPEALYAPLGGAGKAAQLPAVVEGTRAGRAVAGLVTHLHRDHADAGALTAALAPRAWVLEPEPGGGAQLENVGVAQADGELSRSGLRRRAVAAWETIEIAPFSLTALPAVDGAGDPQVSWLIEAGGRRVLHLGDTMFHGFWWRMALRHGPFDLVFVPVNGAVIDFRHRQPPSQLPAVMDPEQAALACHLLGARTVVPMHYGGFALAPFYQPLERAEQRFLGAASDYGYAVRVAEPGEIIDADASTAGT
jgi:L-ascorbate metabolism protein UlaG (beta-lactamase superfamily)